jgi:1-pyrroline-5-carboxylate dehydrogenase
MASSLDQASVFTNEPVNTFAAAGTRRQMRAALDAVRSSFDREHALIIGGRRVKSAAQFASRNPADPAQIIGLVQAADRAQAHEAIAAARQAFDAWSRVSARERAALLRRAAGAVREQRFELGALLVYEVGKSWVEADADVAEGIDFLEYYAREMLRYEEARTLTPVPGESNALHYIPLGAGVVIPPWNFAFAIMVGMTSAALVTGNTVVLKPSSDSPVIAVRFVELLEECGLPPGVVNLLTGSGGAIGDELVKHPQVRFVAFTGSKDVGLHINALAAQTVPGQMWIKRVIAEMGGKDGIVVCADADLNAAVEGVAVSAFGFAGQKCSACSRAIVEAPVYDRFLDKLIARVDQIAVGDPADPENWMGPVINEKAMQKIRGYIDIGKREGRLVAGGEPLGERGYFIEPTVFADVLPDARLAQEEIFGPVLAVMKAKDYDDALAIANNTQYGLTGSVYSSDGQKLQRAREEFFVGNLYLNRKCTGALVGAHPFGGFNMSGTDSKAGGPDYLPLFLQAKSVSEKIA